MHSVPGRYLSDIFLQIDLLLCAFRSNMCTPKGKTQQTEEPTMMNIYQMRNAFDLKVYNTAITGADFEAHFTTG